MEFGDYEKVSDDLDTIEKNDPRMKIKWRTVLGVSFSKKMREIMFSKEELVYEEVFEEMETFVFGILDGVMVGDDAEIIPARYKGNNVTTTKKHAKRNFELTFSSVYSVVSACITERIKQD
jgi:hypothetical protein